MVSIVLPVYNGEKYISESIDSILQQTYKNFELIIVNDASTDRTDKIILEYANKDDRIKIINNETNLKLPKSLNSGFKEAKGDYYTWTSDDNRYEINAIEEMVKKLDKNRNVDFVYSQYAIIDQNGVKKRKGSADYIRNLYIFNCIGACFLYKSKIHNQLNGYNVNTFLYEDYDFWLRAYDSGFKFLFINKVLYEYRIHSKSLSTTKKKDVSKKVIPVLKHNLKKIDYLDFNLRGKAYDMLSNLYADSGNESLVTLCSLISKVYFLFDKLKK